MSETFADKIIEFNRRLEYRGALPDGFRIMNPFRDNPETLTVMERFYRKYYNDTLPRRFIVGINPSRYGSGVTGVPFTDTKRLEKVCGIPMNSVRTHEVSSVFMYDMIKEYGGPEIFYRDFYINSPFPLAIVKQSKEGKWLNANYYDDSELLRATADFILASLREQIALGVDTSQVFVLGVKNAGYIEKLNIQGALFGKITVLEHPRYIQQYRTKERKAYIAKYLSYLKNSNKT